MANLFSNHHMHLINGKANASVTKAARLHRETHPDRRQSRSGTFAKILQRLCETGTFQPLW